jgi:hypothetical protein
LNDHHIRESVELIDKKISVSCQDSIGDCVAFIATSRASCNDVAYLGNGGSATSGYLSDLYFRSSIDPKDDSVDCDVAFPLELVVVMDPLMVVLHLRVQTYPSLRVTSLRHTS